MNVADAFIDSANTSIVSIIEYNCSFEEPWDGKHFTAVIQFQDKHLYFAVKDLADS